MYILLCFLSTLEAPSLSGVCPVFKNVSFKSTMKKMSEKKLFLARGLRRLELPSEMFTCLSFFKMFNRVSFCCLCAKSKFFCLFVSQ